MSNDLTPEQNAERGYTITRTFDAPRQLVWDAITIADQFGQWFGTAEIKVDVQTYDVRPGGAMKATMTYEGNEIPWVGEFKEVEPIERLVLAFADLPELPDPTDLLTFTLTELGPDRTELVLRQSGGHLTDEQYEQAREGTAGFVEAMADVVAAAKAARG
jgi:uncharacterized protein YndB with AHSA1/START domain